MTTDMLPHVETFRRQWSDALWLTLLSFAVTFFCLELIKISGQISPLWFPTALMTMVVFRNDPVKLPLLLAACILGTACANALILGPAPSNLKFPLINLLQALIGGTLLRLLLKRSAPLNSLFSWCKMVAAVGIFTPLLGGLLAIGLLDIDNPAPGRFFTTWVLSEIVGMLAFGPVCLLWQRGFLRRHLRQNVLLEALATLMLTLALCWLTLRYMPWPFTFVIVILFYSAVRLARYEAFVIYLATVSMISLMLVMQQIPADTTMHQLGTMPWIPLLLALIPSHMMTLVMHSFREERKHISESETRFRHAMEYSAIGMALVSTTGQWLQVNKSLCKLFGYSAAELHLLTFQQLTHPEDLDADLLQTNALLSGDIESYSMEKRYLRKDGGIVWALLTVSLVRDSDLHPLYFISQIEDITDLKQTEKVNQRLMERITLANEAGGIGVWEWDLQSGMMSWDKRMFQIYQLPANSQATYLTWLNSLHPADRDMAVTAFDNAARHGSAVDIEFRIDTDTGVRHIRSQCSIVRDKYGNVERMLGINQDVTAMRRLTDALYQEKERMHITLDAIGEAVISTDQQMQVIFMNPVAEKMSGWLQHQASGKPLNEILRITHGSQGPEMDNLLQCDLPQEKTAGDFDAELVLHNRAGEQYAVHYSLSPLSTLEGEQIGSVMVIQDVSESREMMKRLSYSASHDMLTRLPNRVSFENQLKRLIASATLTQPHVLVFIDLDRFKAVNDSAGHAAGDALLREISGVMQHYLSASDFLARLGGDEFGVLLADCSREKAAEVVRRIVAAVNEHPFLWEGRLYRVGASAGLTVIGGEQTSASELMVQADLACYNAKHNGRGQLSIYESQLLKRLKPKMSHNENAQIISQQPMRLQVWAAAPPRKPHAVSFWLAEMQLFSPEGHDIEEAAFRAGLQDGELFLALDRKLVGEFFQHMAQAVIDKALTLALPISGFGLRDEPLVADLLSLLHRYRVPQASLWLAINADILSPPDPLLLANLARLREAGCRIVLRDFGRNLDAFNQLPANIIDYLILAPELVANVHCNLMDEMMVSIIHGHAQRQGIHTLAGPVELPVALNTLSAIGIDTVWGEAVAPRQPLSALLVSSYFAIK